MYKHLNPLSLGVSGRQSELIEAALTYGFRGLDVDAAEIVKRAVALGVEEAARYIRSAKVRVGGWVITPPIMESQQVFDKELERLHGSAEAAKDIGFAYATYEIPPVSQKLPYHENFELHRERLQAVGEVLGTRGIRLGLALKAAAAHREDATHQFIYRAEELLTLLANIGSPHVGLALDTWNWTVGGGGRDQLDELEGSQFVSLSLADLPEDADTNTITDQQRFLPSEASIERHGSLLRSLAQRNYQGPVTLRPHPRQLAKLTRDASVEACSRILDQIWTAAGLSKSGKPMTPAAG